MVKQVFGGDWTEEKLNRIRKYLPAYTRIMKNYNFIFTYIDAFAGTGYRELKDTEQNNQLLFPELIEKESQRFIDGSARIALQVEPRFKRYILIEKDVNKVTELEKLQQEFPDKSQDIKIVNEDANDYLVKLCNTTNWKSNRAVLFLDPFGMQIPWSTIEAIAQTQAIDLWYLFPLGIAVNRLLTKDGNIPEAWRTKLDNIFGTSNWFEAFYKPVQQQQLSLFGDFTEPNKTEKTANFDSISQYFVERLKTVFSGVAENPLLLRNSSNNPLYLLCFASANPKGARTAIKIAQHILKG
jgi:three-Cys-motif partner protein